jgi:hypothetical protein
MEGLLGFAQRCRRMCPGRADGLECQQEAAFRVDVKVANRRARQLTREGDVGTGLRAGRALASLIAEDHRQHGHAQGERERGGQVHGASPKATAGLLLFFGTTALGFGALAFGLSRTARAVELALLLRFACGCLALAIRQAGFQEAPLERDQLVGVGVSSLACLRQSRPTVQRVRITIQSLPFLGALSQVLVQPQSGPIFIQPGT